MAAPDNATFGTFFDGGNLVHGDIVVGLRGGLNARFNFQGDPGLYLPLAGGTMAGAINMNGNTITGLPSPVASTDAVNKAYADALVAGEALSKVDDANVTLSLGGTPLTALLHAVSLTLGWTGQLSVPRGGTGNSTFTAYSVICAGTTATGAFQNVSGLGSSGQVLASNGAGVLPSWQNVPGLVPAALTRVDDSNVTLTLGGTPATSLLQAVSLTLGWTGTLSGTRGGTGVNNGANTATFAGNLNFAAAFSTSGAFAVTQTYTAPTNVTFPTSGTLATTSQLPTGAALTRVDDTNVTLTLGGSPTTALLNAASLTLGWTGQLGLTRGGSGASLTASNGGIIYSTASAMAILAGTATANLPLLSGSSAAPSWGAFALNLGGALTTAAALTTAGAFAATFTFTGITGVTFPTSGTLATTSQIPTGAALTKTDDTNVTLTLGGSPTTALINAASLALGWTGQLSVPRGGTGNSTFTAYSVLCAGTTATGAFQNVSGLGSAGQVLASNGAGLLPSWQTVTVTNAINVIAVQKFTTTGAGTYTPSTGMRYCIIELQAAGSGSGGTTGAGGQSCVSGAGAGGGYLRILATAAQIGASAAISVAAAGTAGASGNNAGGVGGNTTITISASVWTAGGGTGGGGQTSSAIAQASGAAGTGGMNTTGANATLILDSPGQNGGFGFSNGATTIIIKDPPGGDAMLGSGGADTVSGGSVGGNYGGGASGYFNASGANQAGLVGAQGIIIITEFCSV